MLIKSSVCVTWFCRRSKALLRVFSLATVASVVIALLERMRRSLGANPIAGRELRARDLVVLRVLSLMLRGHVRGIALYDSVVHYAAVLSLVIFVECILIICARRQGLVNK